MTVDGESLSAGKAQFDEAQKSPRGSSLGNPLRLFGDITLTLVRQSSDTIDLLGAFLKRHTAWSRGVKCWIIKKTNLSVKFTKKACNG